MSNADAPIHPLLQVMTGPDGVEKVTFTATTGLTKREEFAKTAMQSLIVVHDGRGSKPAELAVYAVEHADALLAALSASRAGQ